MGTVIRAIVGYLFLLVVLRNLGRRPGAQATPSEFVLIFLMGGIIILTTMDDDRSLTNGLVAVITVGAMHRIVSHLKQSYPSLRGIIDGPPLILLKNGQWQREAMSEMLLREEDVLAAARLKGARTLDEVEYAVLERTGSISIITKK